MSTPLDKDTSLTLPSYTVISASAGSGKTHTLTQRFVQILLSEHIPHNSLRNILAVTFTNNAVREMRARVMDYLKALALGDQEKLREATALVSMSEERVREKARVVIEEILNNYSDLQIMTIDGFMTRVFKTSSFDLGFQPDLEIIFDNRKLLREAFEQLTRELHPDRKRTLEKLVDLITETRKASNPFLWDPYSRILYEVRKLYTLLFSQERPVLPGEGLVQADKIKKELLTKALTLRALVKESGLKMYYHLDNELCLVERGKALEAIEKTKKAKIVNAPKDQIERKRHDHWLPILEQELGEYNALLSRFAVWWARNSYQSYIDAIGLVKEVLDRLKHQRGQLLIEDVNKVLNEHLRAQMIVDAYLMLGEQIYHFLIDEFQDTSRIQWANLKPLIENSLSEGGTLFVVGDTRQSIYAFRNADWRIMKTLAEGNEFPSAAKIRHSLMVNRRSNEEILLYAREVFERNVRKREGFAEAANLSGLDQVAQEPTDEHRGKGNVEVVILPWDEEKRPEQAEILTLVDECRARGYEASDIAILTAENERVIEISGWLNQQHVDVLPYSCLDIRTRSVIGELMSLLRFLDSPVDNLSFTSFLFGDIFSRNLRGKVTQDTLCRLVYEASHRSLHRVSLYKSLQETYPDLWNTYFNELYRLVGYLPVYDLVSEAYKLFHVFTLFPEEEASLIKLLDVLKNFEENDRNSLKDFLNYADEEGELSVWQVSVPQDVNAIRVMTIHKAKGLEFNVVIVVLYDRDLRSGRYFIEEEVDGIRLLNITAGISERVDHLSGIAKKQKEENKVDILNKLYVALTRARNEMFVIGLKGVKDLVPSDFLARGVSQINIKEAVRKQPLEERNNLRPFHHDTRTTLGETPFGPIAYRERQRGEFVHLFLSRIEYLDATLGSIDRLLNESEADRPSDEDPDRLRTTLKTFLSHPDVAVLFSRTPDRIVFREQEFSDGRGELFRMDRVIVDPGAVTVVDFKTGGSKSAKEYAKQIRTYLEILRGIYPGRHLRGMLAYVDESAIKEVA